MSIYRARNAEIVRALVTMAQGLGLGTALWALDEPAPGLEDVTVGAGPGLRTGLLQGLLDTLPARPEEVVLADDDVRFRRGDLAQLLRICREAEFGLAQPAHAPASHVSHSITRRRRLSIARRTSFVEIGPLCVLRAPWLERLLPLPAGFGMGWGLDVVWSDLAEDVPMGIVDAVTVEHLGEVAVEYDLAPEALRVADLLAERGVSDIDEIARVLGTWRPWRRRPPWAGRSDSGSAART